MLSVFEKNIKNTLNVPCASLRHCLCLSMVLSVSELTPNPMGRHKPHDVVRHIQSDEPKKQQRERNVEPRNITLRNAELRKTLTLTISKRSPPPRPSRERVGERVFPPSSFLKGRDVVGLCCF